MLAVCILTFALLSSSLSQPLIPTTFLSHNIVRNQYLATIEIEVIISIDQSYVNIQWNLSGHNPMYNYSYDVFYSGDSEVTFQRIASQILETEYVWDSTGFLQKEYIIKIKSLDVNNKMVGEGNSSPFTQGLSSDPIPL